MYRSALALARKAHWIKEDVLTIAREATSRGFSNMLANPTPASNQGRFRKDVSVLH